MLSAAPLSPPARNCGSDSLGLKLRVLAVRPTPTPARRRVSDPRCDAPATYALLLSKQRMTEKNITNDELAQRICSTYLNSSQLQA